jgi:hypothetical protein
MRLRVWGQGSAYPDGQRLLAEDRDGNALNRFFAPMMTRSGPDQRQRELDAAREPSGGQIVENGTGLFPTAANPCPEPPLTVPKSRR